MREKLFIELWNRAKSTYPAGTSTHMSALLAEDFDDFIKSVVSLSNRELLVMLEELSDYLPCEVYTKKVIQIKGQSEQLVCNCGSTDIKVTDYGFFKCNDCKNEWDLAN